MKKLIALVLALAMVAVVGLASAATITVNQTVPSGGTGGAETYVAYKILDVSKVASQANYVTTAGGAGTATGFSYTIKANSGWVSVLRSSTYFTLTPSADGDLYTVVLADDTNNTAAGAKAIADYLKAHMPTSGIVECNSTATGYDATAAATAVDKKYTFVSNGTTASVTVDDGYYIITSTLGTNLIAATSNITINTKNEYVTDNKIREKASVTVGEDATYYVRVNLPANIDQTKAVTVHDELDEHLSFNSGSVVVSTGKQTDIANDTVATLSALTYAADSDYTVTTTGLTDDCTFEITIPAAKVAALMTANKTGDNLNAVSIVFKYTAKLLSTAVADTGYVNREFSTYSEYRTQPTEVIEKTYDFDVKKTDGSAALAGATFELRDAADGTAYAFLAKSGNTYKKATATDASTVTELSGATFKLSGFGEGTYYLVETNAPSGYNKLQYPIVVSITDDGHITATLNGTTLVNNVDSTVADSTSPTVEIEVVNQSGTVLPSTGGIGTTIFYILGGLLVVGAAVILVARRKASN